MLQLGRSGTRNLTELAGLEASDLSTQPHNSFKHVLGVSNLLITSLLEMFQRRGVVIVKVLENVVCLGTIIRSSSGLSVNADSQLSDTAVLLTSLIVTVTLGADKVRVGAFSLQMMLQS